MTNGLLKNQPQMADFSKLNEVAFCIKINFKWGVNFKKKYQNLFISNSGNK